MINSKLLLLGERTLLLNHLLNQRCVLGHATYANALSSPCLMPLIVVFSKLSSGWEPWNSSWTFEHRLCFNLPNFRRNFEVANQVLKG